MSSWAHSVTLLLGQPGGVGQNCILRRGGRAAGAGTRQAGTGTRVPLPSCRAPRNGQILRVQQLILSCSPAAMHLRLGLFEQRVAVGSPVQCYCLAVAGLLSRSGTVVPHAIEPSNRMPVSVPDMQSGMLSSYHNSLLHSATACARQAGRWASNLSRTQAGGRAPLTHARRWASTSHASTQMGAHPPTSASASVSTVRSAARRSGAATGTAWLPWLPVGRAAAPADRSTMP